MTEDQIVKRMAAKYKLTERETRLFYEIYWKKFVLERMNTLEHDIVEVLKLGVFTPKYKTLKYLMRKFFYLRKLLKTKNVWTTENKVKLEFIENMLWKLHKLKNVINVKRVYGDYDSLLAVEKPRRRGAKKSSKHMVVDTGDS